MSQCAREGPEVPVVCQRCPYEIGASEKILLKQKLLLRLGPNWTHLRLFIISFFSIFKSPSQNALKSLRVTGLFHFETNGPIWSQFRHPWAHIGQILGKYGFFFQIRFQQIQTYHPCPHYSTDFNVASINCDFESVDMCGYWSQSVNGTPHWLRHRGSTPAANTGPDVDHTFMNITGTPIYFYFFGVISYPYFIRMKKKWKLQN